MKQSGQWMVSVMMVGLIALVIKALFFNSDLPSSQPLVTAAPVAWTRPMATTPAATSYVADSMKLSEGHWQGMDAMPLSMELKTKLQLPMNLQGVLLGETTMASARSGMLAGDVLVAVEHWPVNTLESLQQASKQVARRNAANLTVYRKGKLLNVTLRSTNGELGFAQMETAPMIFPSDQRPHPYRGPCTDCHAIGSTGHIKPDPDGILLPAPAIRAGVSRTHSDRGPCQACHAITK
ncbi:MAG: magnetochrome domain-containing protein [Magnetococcales bacterium]|nr:magnetochrome domain-containing protein [Magnetococcales bacterium]MBF0440208.1 magnetochrome domain-containing protein [Magnetococcales bacterium]